MQAHPTAAVQTMQADQSLPAQDHSLTISTPFIFIFLLLSFLYFCLFPLKFKLLQPIKTILQHRNVIYLVQPQWLPSRQRGWELPYIKYKGSELTSTYLHPLETTSWDWELINPTASSLAMETGVESPILQPSPVCTWICQLWEVQGTQPALLLSIYQCRCEVHPLEAF